MVSEHASAIDGVKQPSRATVAISGVTTWLILGGFYLTAMSPILDMIGVGRKHKAFFGDAKHILYRCRRPGVE